MRERLLQAFRPVDASSLGWFRAAFGLVMAWEAWTFLANDWITQLWIQPQILFKYYGFEWLEPLSAGGMRLVFIVMLIAALGVAAGYRHRIFAAVLFVTWTYAFLLCETVYQHHFYFISLVSFLLVFLPVGRGTKWAPAWALWLVRAQIAAPYFFGGIAKLNHDWLRGEPMRTWLWRRTDYPLLGRFFDDEWAVYAFSYGGLFFDLFVVPALVWRKTRPYAFGAALTFHLLNASLFDIGIFPWLMMAATTMYFEPDWPRRLAEKLRVHVKKPGAPREFAPSRAVLAGVTAWLALQIALPLRPFLYPGDASWTAEGHRFAWRMRIRVKEGKLRFIGRDPTDGRTWFVTPRRFLSERQASIMETEPDMILQFAHWIAAQEAKHGRANVEVRAESTARLNAREWQPFIDPNADLAKEKRSLKHAWWIVPLRD